VLQSTVSATLSGPSGIPYNPISARPGWGRFALVVTAICAFLIPVGIWGQTKVPARTVSVPSPSTLGQWAPPVNFCTYPCLLCLSSCIAGSRYRHSHQRVIAGEGRHLLLGVVDNAKRRCAGDGRKLAGHMPSRWMRSYQCVFI